MTKKPLTIGNLAKQANINVETIRYYQKLGLIHEPDKPTQGYRIYSKEILSQLLFIKRAKLIGFTLSEIQGLLILDESLNCSDAKLIAQQKLGLINDKLNELLDIKETLEVFIKDCEDASSTDKCIIIQSLKNKS